MNIESIGTLTDTSGYWRLVYDSCGHDQVMARCGLEDLDDAAVAVRRHFPKCLICRPVTGWRPQDLGEFGLRNGNDTLFER